MEKRAAEDLIRSTVERIVKEQITIADFSLNDVFEEVETRVGDRLHVEKFHAHIRDTYVEQLNQLRLQEQKK